MVKPINKLPPCKVLNTLFKYDQATGKVFWNVNRSNNAKIGQEAGSLDSKGYKFVRINRKAFRTHRIVWKISTGKDPAGFIDHINGIQTDNRLGNLRVVTHQNNLRNSKKRKDNTSGVTGISWNKKRSVWRAYIHIDGKMKELGAFVSKEDALKCRQKFAKENEFHSNHGRV